MNRNPLIGQAVGDRIGGPVRMALLLGESLLARGGLDEAHLVSRYLEWHRTDAFDTGPTWSQVFARVETGMSATDAARHVHEGMDGMTAGVNPAHRITSLGCASCVRDEDLAATARAEAALTHAHPQAGEAAAATAIILRGLLHGQPLRAAVQEAAGQTGGEVRERLLHPTAPSPSGYAPLTLEAALHFTREASSFSEAVRSSIDFAGPANYCPVLVGAFASAAYGYEEIPGLEPQPGIARRAQAVFARLWSVECGSDGGGTCGEPQSPA